MREQHFELPLTVTAEHSMNASKHWSAKGKMKREIETLVFVAVKLAKIKPVKQYPIDIVISYRSDLDVDNHGFVAKSIIDGLRYANIIKNDNKRFVRSLTQVFSDRTTVILRENEKGDKNDNQSKAR